VKSEVLYGRRFGVDIFSTTCITVMDALNSGTEKAEGTRRGDRWGLNEVDPLTRRKWAVE
jgi:hypothetical protein